MKHWNFYDLQLKYLFWVNYATIVAVWWVF